MIDVVAAGEVLYALMSRSANPLETASDFKVLMAAYKQESVKFNLNDLLEPKAFAADMESISRISTLIVAINNDLAEGPQLRALLASLKSS